MALYDRVWFNTSTTGTGTITVGAALSGYRTPAGASVPDGGTFNYTILDGSAWEVGAGTYTSAGTTVARSLVSSSTGSLLNLSGSASMFITAIASKTPQLDVAQLWSAAQTFLNASGIKIQDTDASHTLGLVGGSNLTANRTLTLTGGDANRTLDISAASVTISAVAATLLSQATQALMRTSGLGLGTSSTVDTGTSGTKVALTDGANTWSAAQTFSSSAKSTSAFAGIGYDTGAGGTVTQATSKTTSVTLNKVCGQITMNNAALGAGATANFFLQNSQFAVTDVPIVYSAHGTAGKYEVWVDSASAGTIGIAVKNVSAGSLSDALVIGFAIIKAVTS